MTAMQYGKYRDVSAEVIELAVRLGDEPAIITVRAPRPLDSFAIDYVIDEAICAESYEEFRATLQAERGFTVTHQFQSNRN
jgi:hypothetical protein